MMAWNIVKGGSEEALSLGGTVHWPTSAGCHGKGKGRGSTSQVSEHTFTTYHLNPCDHATR